MSNKNISYSERFNSKTRIIFSFKVILREIIRNDDTALQHCWDMNEFRMFTTLCQHRSAVLSKTRRCESSRVTSPSFKSLEYHVSDP